jgi:hypothetical protein
MNFSPESVNHRFITYSDSLLRKSLATLKPQISTNHIGYSQRVGASATPSDMSLKHNNQTCDIGLTQRC